MLILDIIRVYQSFFNTWENHVCAFHERPLYYICCILSSDRHEWKLNYAHSEEYSCISNIALSDMILHMS